MTVYDAIMKMAEFNLPVEEAEYIDFNKFFQLLVERIQKKYDPVVEILRSREIDTQHGLLMMLTIGKYQGLAEIRNPDPTIVDDCLQEIFEVHFHTFQN